MLIPVSWSEPWAAVDEGLWSKLSFIIWLLRGTYIRKYITRKFSLFVEYLLSADSNNFCKKKSLFFVIAVHKWFLSKFRKSPSAKIKRREINPMPDVSTHACRPFPFHIIDFFVSPISTANYVKHLQNEVDELKIYIRPLSRIQIYLSCK